MLNLSSLSRQCSIPCVTEWASFSNGVQRSRGLVQQQLYQILARNIKISIQNFSTVFHSNLLISTPKQLKFVYKCSQPQLLAFFGCACFQTAKKPRSWRFFKRFSFKFLQNQPKLLQNDAFLSLFNIPSDTSPRGRSLKRPREIEPVLSSFDQDFSVQSTNSPYKQQRKTTQLSQFSIYQDAASTADSDNLFSSNDPTPATIEFKIVKIWLNTLNSPCKQRQKTPQLPQFGINQDKTLTQNSDKLSSSNGSTLVTIGFKTSKIWPYISVKIPF